jgi:HSP20 family molecular chaperone IbpA
MKDVVNRVSLPARVLDLLWTDDEFFREVSSNKKVSSSGKFPRCDQWCDDRGFHMAFALAGYSPKDVALEAKGSEICIIGSGTKLASIEPAENISVESHSIVTTVRSGEEEYPAKAPNIIVQKGMIVRGIARRNFKSRFYINQSFDVERVTASMKDGLLELTFPRKREEASRVINICE